jgi:hypothetical protein
LKCILRRIEREGRGEKDEDGYMAI